MSIEAILEVVIGMVFAWLVLSLASMFIQEWIVGKLGWRSSMLETYIGNLLTDPTLAKQLYDHPLIKGLHTGFDSINKPSYIPSVQFSLALLDIIRNASKEASQIQKTLYELQSEITVLRNNKRDEAQKKLDLALSLARNAVSSQGGIVVTSTILDEVKRQIRKLGSDHPRLQPFITAKLNGFVAQKKKIDLIIAEQAAANEGNPDESPLGQLRTGLAVMSMTQPDLKQAVAALIEGETDPGAGNVNENPLVIARKNIETWFDNGMDRLSGWYKRRAQTLTFIICISIAIIFNVDSLQLGNQLWRDPLIRQALAASATIYAQQNSSEEQGLNIQQMVEMSMQLSQLNIPVGWIGTSFPVDSSGAVLVGDGTQKLCTITPKSSVELYGLRFGKNCHTIVNTPKLNDPAGWILKLIGLFVTAAATAQGAPFWFDILKNVVNIRTSGANSDSAAQKATR